MAYKCSMERDMLDELGLTGKYIIMQHQFTLQPYVCNMCYHLSYVGMECNTSSSSEEGIRLYVSTLPSKVLTYTYTCTYVCKMIAFSYRLS